MKKDKNKYFLLVVLIILLSIFLLIFIKNKNVFKKISNIETNLPEQTSEKFEPVSFSITAIGDVLCHNTQYWDAYNKSTDTYDFSYVFDDVRDYTQAGDLTIASLETTFAGKDVGYSNFPTFNSPDELATALSDIGVDIISTAGNHALDKGFSGLSRTIDVLDKANISHLGTYKTEEDQKELLIKDVKGVKIAFINYTYGTNGIPIPSGKDFCVNLIDKDLILKQITQAKDQNVDMIVACMHWGTEYKTNSNPEQEELADFLFQNGVDVIIGNHPHVLEPMEKRSVTLSDGTVKDCFVIYALGNFTADQRDEITRDSIILNLKFTRNEDKKISIDSYEYIPIYMYKNPNLSLKKFKVLDLEKTISNYENGTDTSISSSVYNNLKTQLEKIRTIVEKNK